MLPAGCGLCVRLNAATDLSILNTKLSAEGQVFDYIVDRLSVASRIYPGLLFALGNLTNDEAKRMCRIKTSHALFNFPL